MARVIVILGLMIAITAMMFWLTRKAPVADSVAAPPTSTTVSLAELKSPKVPGAEEDWADKPNDPTGRAEEGHSQVAAEPRLVTNPAVPAADSAASAQEVTAGPVAGAAPLFGTGRIDPRGNASFTGTAAPGDAVSLYWDGKPVSWTEADASGNWTLEFRAPVSSKEHQLYLTARGKDGTIIYGPEQARVMRQRTPDSDAIVDFRSQNRKDNAPVTAAESVGLVIEKIVNGEPGEATLTGRADPGATVRLLANGKSVGEAVVGADGAWSLLAANTSGKAAERVRVEVVGQNGAKLDGHEFVYALAPVETKPTPAATQVAAVEVTKAVAPEATTVALAPPAKVGAEDAPKAAVPELPQIVVPDAPKPAVVAEAPKAEPPKAAVVEPKAGDYPAVLSSKPSRRSLGAAAMMEVPDSVQPRKHERRVIRVRRGDSLWRIARRHLGNGKKWAQFYRLNKHKIDNPDLIRPGQTLILPG